MTPDAEQTPMKRANRPKEEDSVLGLARIKTGEVHLEKSENSITIEANRHMVLLDEETILSEPNDHAHRTTTNGADFKFS